MEIMHITRRALVQTVAAFAALPALAQAPRLPIVFVHGNGDTAGLWLTTFWRFEQNGWPRALLHAVDLRNPNARSVDATPQPGRSSTEEVMRQLAAEVADVRARTGAAQVILVGQSRGGNTIRNYLLNGGGAASCALAILCGAVSHGVIRSDKVLVGSEFNASGPFLTALNAVPGEIAAGVRAVTLRSDASDKFAQPDGRYLGLPGVPTGLNFDAPAIAGGKDVVLPGVDHRETGFAPSAFAAMWREIAGSAPASVALVPEARVVLSGRVTGWEAGSPTNIGIPGATWQVFAVTAATGERIGAALGGGTTAADGGWGPVVTGPDVCLEMVVAAPGLPVTHLYRSPFPRSSDLVHIRPVPFEKDEAQAGSVVVLSRPRGYFGKERDRVLLDGAAPASIPPGVPTVSTARLILPPAPPRSVRAMFNDETVVARTWPASEGRIAVVEITA